MQKLFKLAYNGKEVVTAHNHNYYESAANLCSCSSYDMFRRCYKFQIVSFHDDDDDATNEREINENINE